MFLLDIAIAQKITEITLSYTKNGIILFENELLKKMEAEKTNLNILPSEPQKRPDLLTVLCVLTFIGSGLSFFSYLVFSMSFDSISEVLSESEIDLPGMDMILNTPISFYYSGTLLFGISFWGAIKMWNLKKAGFHLYTASQILLIILQVIYMGQYGFPYLSVFITGVFVLLYFRNLKYMS